MRSLARSALGLALGLLLLTGCSALGGLIPGVSPSTPAATGAASGQSAKAACAALGTVISEAATTLPKSFADAGSDPEKAVKALTTFAKKFGKAVATVDNPQVRAQAQSTLDALNQLVDAADAVSRDASKAAGLAAAFGGVQQQLAAIGSLCAS